MENKRGFCALSVLAHAPHAPHPMHPFSSSRGMLLLRTSPLGAEHLALPFLRVAYRGATRTFSKKKDAMDGGMAARLRDTTKKGEYSLMVKRLFVVQLIFVQFKVYTE